MTIGEAIKKAVYFSVGAIATGAEALADAIDILAVKGEDLLVKSKESFKARKANAVAEDEVPETTVEEDTGDNAPVAEE